MSGRAGDNYRVAVKQKPGFRSSEMSANVPETRSWLWMLRPSRLKRSSSPSTCAVCSRQLHYRSLVSAVLYCYLLIGGVGRGIRYKGWGKKSAVPAIHLLREEKNRISSSVMGFHL